MVVMGVLVGFRKLFRTNFDTFVLFIKALLGFEELAKHSLYYPVSVTVKPMLKYKSND
jgi:hypothetical protein